MEQAGFFCNTSVSAIRLWARGGLFKVTLCAVVIMALGAAMASVFSGRQPSTVGLDVGISLIRIILPFLIALSAQELLAREFERRYYVTSLSYPVSRGLFLFSRFAVMCALVLAALLLFAVVLAAVIYAVGQTYEQATAVNLGAKYAWVMLFIFVESIVLITVAQLLAVTSRTPGFVLIGTLGFALISRSYMAVISLLGQNSTLVDDANTYSLSLTALRFVLPDLGALDIRPIALYDQWAMLPADWPYSLVSVLSYALVLLVLSMLALQRKRFA